MGAARSSVLEGRDIGTVVFPDAEVKIFLTATNEERAQRRTAQLASKGQPADYDAILRDIRERDERDASREAAPLKQADDAEPIDTTGLDIPAIVARITALADARGASEF
jgi:CMP/dCMP kinase